MKELPRIGRRKAAAGGEEVKKRGRKKKEKIDGAPDKKRILELEEENRKLRERIAEDGDDEEYQPDYSLLPNKKNLPSVEELREQIRFEPHYAIGGILIECANRISSIACCSNNIRGDLVRKLRICARKVQAGSLQLSTIIKEKGDNTADKIPQEMHSRMAELERENADLRKCVEDLKEQLHTFKQTYRSEDEDGKKLKKMEREISELKEEKEKMKKEMEMMKKEKSINEQKVKKVQNKEEIRTRSTGSR